MNETLYESELNKMKQDPHICEMKKYSVHGSSNVYDHSVEVAEYAEKIARVLHLQVAETELARGAMLHDFYLYAYKDSGLTAWEHGSGHPMTALHNAEKYYDLTDREKDIIKSHMWPMTPKDFPHYKESFIIGTADKISAVKQRTQAILSAIPLPFFRRQQETAFAWEEQDI